MLIDPVRDLSKIGPFGQPPTSGNAMGRFSPRRDWVRMEGTNFAAREVRATHPLFEQFEQCTET